MKISTIIVIVTAALIKYAEATISCNIEAYNATPGPVEMY